MNTARFFRLVALTALAASLAACTPAGEAPTVSEASNPYPAGAETPLLERSSSAWAAEKK